MTLEEQVSEAGSVIVVGGGTVGLAAAWRMAERGWRVTVVERHGHVHDFGSHGGFTRIIRQAYHEGSGYVPLVQEADRAWLELEQRVGARLLVRAGLLEFGPPQDRELQGAIEACRRNQVPHELLTGREAAQRWPFTIPDAWTVCFTPSGGFLRVRACLDAMRDQAVRHGATLRHHTRVAAVELGPTPTVVLDDGTRLSADRVVVCAGAGLPSLLGDLLPGRLACLRRVLAWTRPAEAHRDALSRIPVWGAFLSEGFFYGFPHGDEGVTGLKIACHTSPDLPDVAVDPETVDRNVHAADLEPLRAVLERHLPAGVGPFVAHRVCLYTVTPSWDFVIDRHPDDDRIVVAGGFSGHGFKFAPTIGRLVADLVSTDAPPHPGFSLADHLAGSSS